MKTEITKFKTTPINLMLDRLTKKNAITVFRPAIQTWFAFNLKTIQKDLRTKFQKDVTTELTDWEFLDEQGQTIMKPATLKVMKSGGDAAYSVFAIEGSFDIVNPNSVIAAEKFTAKLVTGVNTETKKGIRTFISSGIKDGKGMDTIARELRPIVGLTKVQTTKAIDLRKMLNDKEKFPNLTQKQINGKVTRYTNKAHRDRTTNIARTETARAQNIGYAQGMENVGVELLEFSITEDEITESECRALNENKYPPSEAAGIIPVHPRCRCAMLPVIGDVSICRGGPGEVAKKACLMPEPKSLNDHQTKSLLKKLGKEKNTTEIKLLKFHLRTLGYKGKLPAPKLKPKPATKPKPKPKPTAISGRPVDPKIPQTKPAKEKLTPKEFEKSLTQKEEGMLKSWMEPAETGGGTSEGGWITIRELEITSPKNPRVLDFNRLLDRAPSYKGTVYRIGHDGKLDAFSGINKKKVGDKITTKSSTSSSSATGVRNDFLEDHLGFADDLEVYSVKIEGSASNVDLRKIGAKLAGFDEKEVIVRKGTKYEIKSIKIKHDVDTDVKYKEIVLKEI